MLGYVGFLVCWLLTLGLAVGGSLVVVNLLRSGLVLVFVGFGFAVWFRGFWFSLFRVGTGVPGILWGCGLMLLCAVCVVVVVVVRLWFSVGFEACWCVGYGFVVCSGVAVACLGLVICLVLRFGVFGFIV